MPFTYFFLNYMLSLVSQSNSSQGHHDGDKSGMCLSDQNFFFYFYVTSTSTYQERLLKECKFLLTPRIDPILTVFSMTLQFLPLPPSYCPGSFTYFLWYILYLYILWLIYLLKYVFVSLYSYILEVGHVLCMYSCGVPFFVF